MVSKTTKYPPISPDYRVLFQLIQDISVEFLTLEFEEMFTKVEPVIIDFASKADTNNSQAYFFDSITEINLGKDEVQDWFFTELKAGFQRFSEGMPIGSYGSPDAGEDANLLQIIGDDDLELHLAMVNMATKVNNRCHQDLYQLGQRLAVLRSGHQVSELENPLGPTNISGVFHSASNVLDLDKERLLIFYVLFEKTVMASMHVLYDRINAEFVKADIYPNLWKPTASKLEAPEAPERQSPSGSNPDKPLQQKGALVHPVSPEDFELGVEVFNSILSFLTERRREDPRFSEHIEFRPDGDLSQLKSKPAVVSTIHDFQHSAQPPSDAFGPDEQKLSEQAQNPYLLNYAKAKIHDEREGIYGNLDENTIPTADLDTIDLVGMLFEEVLGDDDLANITKALICHLHTLYLKVAIVDPLFLREPEHVARQFLNRAISAGHDWIDDARIEQGLYQPLEEIISSLMQNFEQDMEVFSQHDAMLVAQIEQLQKRAKIIEERSREATKGRDRLEFARQKAASVIDENLKCDLIHPVIGDFIYHEWKDCMTMMLLRNPSVESSRDWRSILMVVHSLSKICAGQNDAQGRAWLKNILPILQKHIDHSLSYLGDDHRAHTNGLIALLTQWSVGQVDAADLRKKSDYTKKSDPAAKPAVTKKKLTPQEVAILGQLKQTKLGSWFEFDEANGKKSRVKLSWYSSVTRKHMFIDRFGAKAYIVPTDILITKIDQGSARIIDRKELAFVDRALLKIHSLVEPN